MRVLVTGGAGFIGSHACLELLNDNHIVHVLDDLSEGYEESLLRVEKITSKNILFTKANLLDKNSLIKVFKRSKPEVVIHFAGFKSVNESVLEPMKYYRNNVTGSINLLEVMSEYECNKIIFSSSATVYGKPNYLPLDENHSTNPINPYGHSKLIVERILKDWFSQSKNRSVVILRYFNPVGAHPSGMIGEGVRGVPNNLMPYIVQVASGIRDRLYVFGDDYKTEDGTGKRDFIHIVDLARAHVKSVKMILKNNEYNIFNIGTGVAYSVFDLVRSMEKAANSKINISIANRRQGDLAEVWADTSLANKKLKWKAEYNIEDMCRDTWNWQINNPKGYK